MDNKWWDEDSEEEPDEDTIYGFIYYRCEMDHYKTKEIMYFLRSKYLQGEK